MRTSLVLLTIALTFLAIPLLQTEPGFNGATPGCNPAGGCHTSQSGIVTVEVLSNLQVRITLSGTHSRVAGELVDVEGNVVAVNNSTSSNPFILTAPSAGLYTVNAGYKSPREWGTTSADITVTGIEDKLIGSNPNNFELFANYPNPFNPSTKIRYAIPQASFTVLKIYNIMGQEVATLINEEKAAGVYEVNFNAINLASGTYLYKLQAGSFVETRKMILLK
jgi:hypothetical protein